MVFCFLLLEKNTFNAVSNIQKLEIGKCALLHAVCLHLSLENLGGVTPNFDTDKD